MYQGMLAETVTIAGHGDEEIGAYLARPLGAGPFPGVLVIHHAPGWDAADQGDRPAGSPPKDMSRSARTCITVSGPTSPRMTPPRRPAPAAGSPRSSSSVTPAGALRVPGRLPVSNGKVGSIGYCSGGRQSFLAACELPVDAAVDCYGAFVVSTLAAGAAVPDGAGHRSRVQDLVPDPRALRRGGQESVTRRSRARSMPSSRGSARSTSSIRSRTPVTASSPSIGPCTGWRRPSRAGGSSSISTAAT